MRTGTLVGALVVSSTLSLAGCAYPKHTEMVELQNAVVPPHAVAPPPPSPPACTCDDDAAEARGAAADLAVDLVQAVLAVVFH